MSRLATLLGRADWLDAARMRRWTGVCLAVQLICGVVLAAGTHGWLVRLPGPTTTDFVSFYAAGRLAGGAAPARVYDVPTHFAAEQAATQRGILYVHFFYPPVYLLYCRALAWLPYLPAFVCFELAGLAFCAAMVRAIIGPVRWWWLPFASFSPALWNFGFGQNAFMTAGLFGAGTLLLHRQRPVLAGLVLGLLLYKPHTGLLLPLALAASANWRAIGGACVSVTVQVGLSVWAFGIEAWQRFLPTLQHSVTTFGAGGVTPFATMINVLGMARDHGAGVGLAWGLQAIAQVAVGVAIAGCWRGPARADSTARYAALASGALLAMPMVLFYDLTTLAIAGAWIMHDARRTGFLRGEKCTLACIWLGGLLCYPVGRAAHLPLGLLCVVAMFALSLRRSARVHYRSIHTCTSTLSPVSCTGSTHDAGHDDKTRPLTDIRLFSFWSSR